MSNIEIELQTNEVVKMNKMRERLDYILSVVIGVCFVILCMIPLTNILLSPVPFITIIFSSSLMYIVLRLLMSSKPGKIIATIVLAVFIIVFLFLLLDKGSAHKVFSDWMVGLYFSFEKLYFFEPLVGSSYESYHMVIFLILSAATAFAVWFFKDWIFKFIPLVGYGMACYLLSYEMASIEMKVPFVLFTILATGIYTGRVFDKRKKEGLGNESSGINLMIVQSIPIIIIALLITFVIPKQPEPLRWKWLDQQFNKAYSRIEEKFTHTDTEFFSLSATGFSGRDHLLGGRVRQSNTYVMDVKAEKRAYLRGAAYLNYTGTSWLLADPGFDYEVNGYPESSVDIDELGTVFNLVHPQYLELTLQDDDQNELLAKFANKELNELLFPSLTMGITYKNMTTRTVMSPLKTILPIKNLYGEVLPIQENNRGVMLTQNFLSSGSFYKIEYKQPMYGDEIFQKLLPVSYKGLYNTAINAYVSQWTEITNKTLDGLSITDENNEFVFTNIVDADGKAIINPNQELVSSYILQNLNPTLTPSYQKILELSYRASDTERKYITLPDTVTERVRQFARDATEGLQTDYEKVIAIRDILRKEYPYTLITPRLPEKMDFVDWFLFEQKSGYCTSFATSMTVLLRTIGIPARYVEGYVLPEKDEADETYKVTNKSAHAWVEVYFEGFGWLTFEPTPGFSGVTEFLALSDSEMEDFVVTTGDPNMEDLMRQYGRNRIDPNEGPFDSETESDLEPVSTVTIVFGGMGLFVVLLIIIHLLSQLISMIVMNGQPNRHEIVMRYMRMLRWLSLADISLSSGESLNEFSGRVDNEYYFPETSFKELSALFGRVRYGAKEPSLVEVHVMRNMYKELHRQIVRDIGILRFIPLRYMIIGI